MPFVIIRGNINGQIRHGISCSTATQVKRVIYQIYHPPQCPLQLFVTVVISTIDVMFITSLISSLLTTLPAFYLKNDISCLKFCEGKLKLAKNPPTTMMARTKMVGAVDDKHACDDVEGCQPGWPQRCESHGGGVNIHTRLTNAPRSCVLASILWTGKKHPLTRP